MVLFFYSFFVYITSVSCFLVMFFVDFFLLCVVFCRFFCGLCGFFRIMGVFFVCY